MVVPGGDEQVWDEAPHPTGKCDDELVFVFFVHRLEDVLQLPVDGRVVPHSPVCECVLAGDGRIENAWASHSHHSFVVADEVLWNAVFA